MMSCFQALDNPCCNSGAASYWWATSMSWLIDENRPHTYKWSQARPSDSSGWLILICTGSSEQSWCVGCAGEVKLSYLSRPYFVTMGLFLMAVLLPFNTSTSLTFRDLREATQLDHKDLSRHVQQLLDIKLISATAENVVQMSTAEVTIVHTFSSDDRVAIRRTVLCSSLLCMLVFSFYSDPTEGWTTAMKLNVWKQFG